MFMYYSIYCVLQCNLSDEMTKSAELHFPKKESSKPILYYYLRYGPLLASYKAVLLVTLTHTVSHTQDKHHGQSQGYVCLLLDINLYCFLSSL